MPALLGLAVIWLGDRAPLSREIPRAADAKVGRRERDRHTVERLAVDQGPGS